ncbi:MAG: DUF4258 domain-containing protein [Bacteroidetes bacterium]|nr:DUF4258 domain-containing protein [Bacteroidota bacterium]
MLKPIIFLLLLWSFAGCIPAEVSNEIKDEGYRETDIVFTKHAKCRMKCRFIDEAEVREIIANGDVNMAKSNSRDRPCPTFALEGITSDKQHVRIVIADCDGPNKVVTAIDLENDYACDCK